MVSFVIQGESSADEYRRVIAAWRAARDQRTEQDFLLDFSSSCPASEISMYMTGLFRTIPIPPRPRNLKLGWKRTYDYQILISLKYEDWDRSKYLGELLEEMADEIPWDVMICLHVVQMEVATQRDYLPDEMVRGARAIRNVSLEHWDSENVWWFLQTIPGPTLFRSLRIIHWGPEGSMEGSSIADWVPILHSLDLRDILIPEGFTKEWDIISPAIAQSSLEHITFVNVGGIVLRELPKSLRSLTYARSILGKGMVRSLGKNCRLLERLQLFETVSFAWEGVDYLTELEEALLSDPNPRLWSLSLSGLDVDKIVRTYMKSPGCRLEELNMEQMTWKDVSDGLFLVPAWSLLRTVDIGTIDEGGERGGVSAFEKKTLMTQIVLRTRIHEFTSITHRIAPRDAKEAFTSNGFRVAQAILAGIYLGRGRGSSSRFFREIPWTDFLPLVGRTLGWRNLSDIKDARIERIPEDLMDQELVREGPMNLQREMEIIGRIHGQGEGEVARILRNYPKGWGWEFIA